MPYKIHIVKDHDLKERLCLEVERLGLSAMIMGSRGFGAAGTRRTSKLGRLGTVSDYCVHHCVCPVVVVRYPEDREADGGVGGSGAANGGKEAELHPVPEEEDHEYHDASDEYKGLTLTYPEPFPRDTMILAFGFFAGGKTIITLHYILMFNHIMGKNHFLFGIFNVVEISSLAILFLYDHSCDFTEDNVSFSLSAWLYV